MAGVGVAAVLSGVGLFTVRAYNNEHVTNANQLGHSAADFAFSTR